MRFWFTIEFFGVNFGHSLCSDAEQQVMGDLVLRVSLLVQRGWACQRCGCEIDGRMTGTPRECRICSALGENIAAPDREKLVSSSGNPAPGAVSADGDGND